MLLTRVSRQNSSKKVKAWAHLVTELAMSTNLTTLFVYWGLIHNVLIKENRPWNIRFMGLCFHTIPPIVVFTCFAFLNFRFIYRHFYLLPLYSGPYSFVNFIATKLRGKPIYFFVKWEDIPHSIAICVGLSVFMMIMASSTPQFYSFITGCNTSIE